MSGCGMIIRRADGQTSRCGQSYSDGQPCWCSNCKPNADDYGRPPRYVADVPKPQRKR
jgi:hypothetical protein